MDDDILSEALAIAGSEKDQAWYAPRCTTLTRFARYCGTAILNPGGNGVLEPELRQIVAPVVGRAQAAQGIARPDLRTGKHPLLFQTLLSHCDPESWLAEDNRLVGAWRVIYSLQRC